ncbi:2-oxoglutarate and iron-dependent oxygenase JMJD4 isoform X2 [Amia ocellicauda]|uniref:2-oxoglutarate and iron-dependent oxygenase JMJD4 isoform X2 n=1 Tax=Amia ocellicauda TaxID=2972642 RepID=UPI003464A145
MDKETFLAVCSAVRVPRPSYDQACVADYMEADGLSYSSFFRRYLLPNCPCVLAGSLTQEWPCRKLWVTGEGKPDFQRLLHDFGDAQVPVADCSVKEYNANPKQILPFRDYIAYWKEYIQLGHSSPKGCLYLKDWHMHRQFPEHSVYRTPVYFSSDWLNEYWDSIEVDDYRFVYMGPKGSWTPFHADVFRSYSWSANVCGRKKWLLYPPGQEEYLKDCHGNLTFDVTSPVLQDEKLYPQYHKACQPLEVIQEAGEVIFVPSGWHHQVYNLVIMKSCTGIDYGEFYTFLKIIAENRLSVLGIHADCTSSGSCRRTPDTVAALGPHHATFDLQRVAHILECLLSDQDFQRLDTDSLPSEPASLLGQITEAVALAL